MACHFIFSSSWFGLPLSATVSLFQGYFYFIASSWSAVKSFLHLIHYEAMNAYERLEALLHSFLTSLLGGSECHAPAALAPLKEPWYALNRRLGGPQNQPGLLRDERISRAPAGNESKLLARDRSNGKALNSLLWMSPVRILFGTPSALVEIFNVFPQSLQTNVVLRIGHDQKPYPRSSSP
jgi:hypothetical protein